MFYLIIGFIVVIVASAIGIFFSSRSENKEGHGSDGVKKMESKNDAGSTDSYDDESSETISFLNFNKKRSSVNKNNQE